MDGREVVRGSVGKQNSVRIPLLAEGVAAIADGVVSANSTGAKIPLLQKGNSGGIQGEFRSILTI